MEELEWLCRENEILVYLPTTLINGKFELVPWCETWYVNLFGFVSVKWKYWFVPCRENEILAYMVTISINMKVELAHWFKTWYLNLFDFKISKMKVLKWPLSRSLLNGKFELVPRCSLLQTWYVNLFGFVFGKMKVLDWPLSRKWDFGLYAPTSLINGRIGMTLSRMYLVLYSVKWKYWNDFVSNVFGFVFGKMKVLEWLCCKNEILVYLSTTLINGKFELVPWCETW